MARVRFSGLAQADLAAILDTSRDRWGEAARTRYAALLEAALQSIAADPEGPLTRARAEIFPGVRSFHTRHARRTHGVKTPVHVVYFRIGPSGAIEILRVLHERTEPSLHVMHRRSTRPRDARRRRPRGSRARPAGAPESPSPGRRLGLFAGQATMHAGFDELLADVAAAFGMVGMVGMVGME